MQEEKSKSSSRSCGFIRNFDLFGQPIGLNYQGEDSFRTVPGGILSIVFYIITLATIYFKLMSLLDGSNWNLVIQNTESNEEEL